MSETKTSDSAQDKALKLQMTTKKALYGFQLAYIGCSIILLIYVLTQVSFGQ